MAQEEGFPRSTAANPCTFPRHEKSPIAGAHTYQWRRRRGSRVAFGNAQRVRRFAPHPLAGHRRQRETLAGALGSVSVHRTLTWFESPAPSPDMKRAPSLGLILTYGGGGGIPAPACGRRSWGSLRSPLGRPQACQDLAVRIPCAFPRHEKSPVAGARSYLWRRRRDSNPRTP